jgi:serine/threonine protein kinase
LFKEAKNSRSPSTRSYSKENNNHHETYAYPEDSSIKIIDFGGATFENDRHSDIINTRQYRSPEVILGLILIYVRLM